MIDVQVWICAAKLITAAEDKYKSLRLHGRNVCLDIFLTHCHLKLFLLPRFSLYVIIIEVLIYEDINLHICSYFFSVKVVFWVHGISHTIQGRG